MAQALPHWLQIDPLASVQRLLQGYATGAQIGESLRAGEQHAADAADTNARFESELAHREANAQREYQLHAQLQQEKAEVAARSLAGMQEYQQLVASGMPKEQALMRAAPNLFYKQPDKLMNTLHELQLEKQNQENATRLAKSQETTDQFRKAQVNHWDTTAAETKRANQERERRLTETVTPNIVLKDVPGVGTIVYNQNNPKTGIHVIAPGSKDIVNLDKADINTAIKSRDAAMKAFATPSVISSESDREMWTNMLNQAEQKISDYEKNNPGSRPSKGKSGTDAKKGKLTLAQAQDFLRKTNGDRAKAEALAKEQGYDW